MKKYSINLIWSDEDEGYIATISEFPGLSAFGETAEEAIEEAKVALQGFIEVFKEDGCEVPQPQTLEQYSGQTRLRLPKSLHAKLTRQADREGASLNTYMVQLLAENHLRNQIDQRLKRIENKTNIKPSFKIAVQSKDNEKWERFIGSDNKESIFDYSVGGFLQ